MAITDPRYKILPLRGFLSDLTAEIANIAEGEICYATNFDRYYQKEGGVLVQVNPANLGTAYSPTDVLITSSSGDDTTIAGASAFFAGVMVAADKLKLDGIPSSAIPEAPTDGYYYVRHNSDWVYQDVTLLQRYIVDLDGGDIDTGISLGAFLPADGGDFDTGVSIGPGLTVDAGFFVYTDDEIDGGDFGS